jgi:hypothetical protein
MATDQALNERMEILIDGIGEVVNGNEFDTVMNALVYMVAHGAVSTDIDKETFLKKVADQLDNLYDYIMEVRNGNSSVQ